MGHSGAGRWLDAPGGLEAVKDHSITVHADTAFIFKSEKEQELWLQLVAAALHRLPVQEAMREADIALREALARRHP
jgi:hypothetical protein